MTSEIFWKFNKYKTSIDEKFIIERVITDLVWGLRCPINCFTDVCFMMVVYVNIVMLAFSSKYNLTDRVIVDSNPLKAKRF